jgi:hypothetical protein
MTKDEALHLALEALEYRGTASWRKRQPAITAIKAALEEKNEPLGYLEPTASPDNACYNPSQRTWVGLTDEDFAGCSKHEAQWARYWEKLLKERNT